MKLIVCERCGADSFIEQGKYMVCEYCGAKFLVEDEKSATKTSNNQGIALDDDVERLLEKCRKNPRNARRYASLILDIDPTNKDAIAYYYGFK